MARRRWLLSSRCSVSVGVTFGTSFFFRKTSRLAKIVLRSLFLPVLLRCPPTAPWPRPLSKPSSLALPQSEAAAAAKAGEDKSGLLLLPARRALAAQQRLRSPLGWTPPSDVCCRRRLGEKERTATAGGRRSMRLEIKKGGLD